MDRKFISDQVIFSPEINPPAVAPFTLKNDVPTPLPSSLPTEHLPLIVPLPPPSGYVTVKEDDVVV